MSTDPVTAERGPAPRRRRATSSLFGLGEPMLWLTGGALALALLMIVGLVGLIAREGTRTFWPTPVALVETADGIRIAAALPDNEVRAWRERGTPLSG